MKLTGIRTAPMASVKVTGGQIYELFREEIKHFSDRSILDNRLADGTAGQLLVACVQAFECGTSSTDERSQLLTSIERLVGELTGRISEPGVSDALAMVAQLSTDEGFLNGRVSSVAATAQAAIMSCAEVDEVYDVTEHESLMRRVYDIEPGDACPPDILTDETARSFMDAVRYFEKTGTTIYRDYAISFWELAANDRGSVGKEQFLRLTRMLWEATGEGRFADAFEREYGALIGAYVEHCSTMQEMLVSAPGAGAVAICDGGLAILRYGDYEFHGDGTAFKTELSPAGCKLTFTMPYDGFVALRLADAEAAELTVDGCEYDYAITGAGCGSAGFALVGGPFEQGSVTCMQTVTSVDDISAAVEVQPAEATVEPVHVVETPAEAENIPEAESIPEVEPTSEVECVPEPVRFTWQENDETVASAPSLISLVCDGCAVYYSPSLNRYLIRLSENAEQRYTWEGRVEVPIRITADAECYVDVDGKEADRDNIILSVTGELFTGHRLRLHSIDCSYVTSYDVVILREALRNAELNMEDTAHQAADAYGDVRGSFAGELCYVWDASGDAGRRGLSGTYGSSAGQQYGADPTTGYFWGSSGDRLCRRYRFELENGNYELKLGFTSPEWAGSRPTLKLDRGSDRERVLDPDIVIDGSIHTYRVRISKGMLDLSIESADGSVDASTIEIRAQQTIAQSGDYALVSGEAGTNGRADASASASQAQDEHEDNLSFIARMQEKARYYEKLEAEQEAQVVEFEKKLAAEIAEIDTSTWVEEEPDDLDLTGMQMIGVEEVEDTLDEPMREFATISLEEPEMLNEEAETSTEEEELSNEEAETPTEETELPIEEGGTIRRKWAFEEQAEAEEAAAQALLSKKTQLVREGRKTLTGVAGALALGAGIAALLKKK